MNRNIILIDIILTESAPGLLYFTETKTKTKPLKKNLFEMK